MSTFQQLDTVENRDQRLLHAFNRSLALLKLPTKIQWPNNRIVFLEVKLKHLCKLLSSPKIWRFLPSLEIEMDLKGSVAVVGKCRKVAFVQVAAIKSSHANSRKEFKEGKGTDEVARVRIAMGSSGTVPASDIALTGHMFVTHSDGFVA